MLKFNLRFVYVVLIPLLSTPAAALESGVSQSIIEEVLVTATKKAVAENAQTVPIAVSVFSGEALESAQMNNMSDLQVWIPNVQLEEHTTVPSSTSFSIRGLGTGSSIPSDDPPVGVFMDGIVMGILHGSNLDVFDLETVEVLRGPQGTLFGRNVSAGAIVARTRRPTFEFEGDISVTAGNFGRQDAAVRLSGPLVEDQLAGKITVLYRSHDGFHENEFTGTPVTQLFGRSLSLDEDYGEEDSLLIRPSLRITPSETLTIDIIGEYGKTDGDGMPWRAVFSPFGAPLPSGEQDIIAQHNGLREVDTRGVVVDVNWTTASGTLTSITGWRDNESLVIFDTEGSATSVFDFYISPEQDQFSQELRWSGTPFDNNVEVTLGAYYFSQDVVYREGRLIFGFVSQGLGGDIEHDTWAVFSNVSILLGERNKLEFGLRYTEEQKETQQVVGQTNGFCDVITGNCTFNFVDDDDWSNVTPSISFSHAISDDSLLWLSYSRGYRSGGFNLRHTNEAESPVYDEEVVDAFEVGYKADIGEKLRLNTSVFHHTYDDQQVVRLNPDASQVTVNAAKSTALGLDLELTWIVTDSFSVRANAGVIDTEIDDMDPGVLAAINAGRAVTNFPRVGNPAASPGLPPVRVSDLEIGFPTETAGLTLQWDVPFNNGAYLTFNTSASYTGEYTSGNQIFDFDATTMVNFGVSYTSGDAKWNIALFGENVTDEEYILGYVESALGITAPTLPGPRWALQVNYSI